MERGCFKSHREIKQNYNIQFICNFRVFNKKKITICLNFAETENQKFKKQVIHKKFKNLVHLAKSELKLKNLIEYKNLSLKSNNKKLINKNFRKYLSSGIDKEISKKINKELAKYI